MYCTQKELSIRNLRILFIEMDFMKIPSDNAVLCPVDVGTVVRSPNNKLYLVRDRIVP